MDLFKNFLAELQGYGVKLGREKEHDIKKRVCKYFCHKGGVMWEDGCAKTGDNCYLEKCPANKEEIVSVRDQHTSSKLGGGWKGSLPYDGSCR
jgi:hypothetical protein